MHASTIASAVFVGLLTVVASKPDVGGPHGVQGLWKKDLHLVHRRHHLRASVDKRSGGKLKRRGSGKCSSRSGSSNGGGSSSSSDFGNGNNANSSNGSSKSSSSGASNGGSDSGNYSNSTASSENTSGGSSASTSSVGLNGISSFLGTNSGIGSWFRTDNSNDDTNGRSWCQLNYQDDWMGFAPDVSTMLSNFGNDITKAGTAYCGLQAKATNPSNAMIYIVDGFDPKWVRTPGSIDLTLAAFAALYGSSTDDKNTVIQGLQWELTGERNTAYAFNAGS